MITILHGDHAEASRGELTRILSNTREREIRKLDGKILDSAAFTQTLQSSSLFGSKILVVIERLFAAKNKKSKELGVITRLLNESAGACEIVLWEDKELDVTSLKSFSTAQIRLFKIPTVIFQFLDNLKPNNAKQLLAIYQTLVESAAAELVFSMMVRRLRQLMVIAAGDKPTGVADWQLARLTKQASFFTMEKLTDMHQKLLDAEYSLKSGISPYQLTEHIEQFLIAL